MFPISSKLTAATVTGAVCLGIVALVNGLDIEGLHLSAEFAATKTTILAGLVAWAKRENRPPQSARDAIAAEQRQSTP
jgi:hypothetical protein